MYVSIFLFHLSIWFFFLISEIGVALTTFGGLFMLLGVMLFFDGALLALGNVGNFLPLPISSGKEAHIYPPSLSFSLSLSLYLKRNQKKRLTAIHICAYLLSQPCSSLFHSQQILFISGLTLIIGPHKTFYFFARKQKIRGTLCFFGGVLLVFLKWPFTGMMVETFGFLNLFG